MHETDLTLTVGGLPPLSARGCTQTLSPAPLGALRRTINGSLVFTGLQSHKKSTTLIHGSDKAPPAFEGLWRGREATVGCLSPLTQKIDGDGERRAIELERPPVEGSVQVYGGEDRTPLPLSSVEGRRVVLENPLGEGETAYAVYRPLLRMTVTGFSQETDEWGVECAWKLALEEV